MASTRALTSLAFMVGGLAGSNAALQVRKTLKAAPEEDATSVIDSFFESVPHGGGVNRKVLAQQDQGAPDNAAEMCSRVNWGTFAGVDDTQVQKLMDALGLLEYCDQDRGSAKDDPTCLAFWAGLKAHMELQKQGFRPRFANYNVVNWFQKEDGHYPSWGEQVGVTVSYAPGEAPSAQMNDPNVVSPWAYCNIVENVLKQVNDQVGTSTCGPTAVLAALTDKNPAGTIKMGLELYWTGTLRQMSEVVRPCDYIYDEFPGIVPFHEGQPGWGGQSVACKGAAQDCAQSSDQASQNAGIQFMWSQAMGSGLARSIAGSCAPEDFKVKYPGIDEKGAELADAAQQSSPFMVLTLVQQLISKNIDYKSACISLCSESSDAAACEEDLCMLGGLTGVDLKSLQMSLSQFAEDTSGALRENYERSSRIKTALAKMEARGQTLQSVVPSVLIPSLTQDLLEESCSAPNGAILFINSNHLGASETATVGSTMDTACNHWVFLERCNGGADGSSLVIWSWGLLFHRTRENFMHALEVQDTGKVLPWLVAPSPCPEVCGSSLLFEDLDLLAV